jgi:hypothetical protein
VVWVECVSRRGRFGPNAGFCVQTICMKNLSVFGAFRFSEFRIRDCVPVLSLRLWNRGGCDVREMWHALNDDRLHTEF